MGSPFLYLPCPFFVCTGWPFPQVEERIPKYTYTTVPKKTIMKAAQSGLNGAGNYVLRPHLFLRWERGKCRFFYVHPDLLVLQSQSWRFSSVSTAMFPCSSMRTAAIKLTHRVVLCHSWIIRTISFFWLLTFPSGNARASLHSCPRHQGWGASQGWQAEDCHCSDDYYFDFLCLFDPGF